MRVTAGNRLEREANMKVCRRLVIIRVAAVLEMIVLGLIIVSPNVWTGPAMAAGPGPRLATVRTWAFAIGNGALSGLLARRAGPFDLVVVDGEGTTAAQVAQLRRTGTTTVLAYLSVGTIEPYRSWYRAAAPYRLAYWRQWGEWYADVSRAGYRDLILHAVAPGMLAKGFDGLFLDNTAMIGDYPAQAAGMAALVRGLSALAHTRHGRYERGLLFTQNGEDTIGPMVRYLDGWNREDVTSTYDADRHAYVRQSPGDVRAAMEALRRLRGDGLLVTATDYTAPGDAAATRAAVRNACASGALPFVSDIGLSRLPAHAYHCL